MAGRKRTSTPTANGPFPSDWTVADLLAHFGGISPRRIRLQPAPGTAVERDVTAIQDREDRLYELVDGVLVEKVMGFLEGHIAAEIIRYLGNFVAERDPGFHGECGVTGRKKGLASGPRPGRLARVGARLAARPPISARAARIPAAIHG